MRLNKPSDFAFWREFWATKGEMSCLASFWAEKDSSQSRRNYKMEKIKLSYEIL